MRHVSVHLGVPFAALFAAQAGCGQAALRSEVGELGQRVQTLEQENARKDDKIADLEDRVAILSDQMAALGKGANGAATASGTAAPAAPLVDPPPALPVVRLSPPPPAPPRPRVLRLAGAPPAAAAPPTGTLDLPDPAKVTDRLPVSAAVAPLPVEGAPLDDYRLAYAALQGRDYPAAAVGFQRFLDRYPQDPYADHALYWLGETYYAQQDFHRALAEFQALVQRYPAGEKVPAALLKAGLCELNLGDRHGARDLLDQVASSYPQSDAARVARTKLQEIQ